MIIFDIIIEEVIIIHTIKKRSGKHEKK